MKLIILFLMTIFLSIIVLAVKTPYGNLETFPNAWTKQRDWITSLNQTGNNMIIGNLTVIGTINATKLNGSLECLNMYGGTDLDYCVDATGSGFTAGGTINATNINISKLLNITSNIYLDYGTPNQCVQFDANNKLTASGAGCGGSPDTSSYFRNENFTDRLVLNLSDISRFINLTINLTLYQPISNVSKLSFSNFQISNWTTLYNAEASTRFSFANNLTSTSNVTISNITVDNIHIMTPAPACPDGYYQIDDNGTVRVCSSASLLPFSNFQLSNISNNTVTNGQLTANITSLNNSLNKYGWVVNNTDFKPRSINITGGAGTMNLTIGNGSLSATISYNGSHFIFG